LDQFSTKNRDIEAEELNAKNAFEQLTQQLTDNIENAEHEISKRSEMRAGTQKTKAEAEGDLAQTTNDRDEDQVLGRDDSSLRGESNGFCKPTENERRGDCCSQ
jgi:hypothetical protein